MEVNPNYTLAFEELQEIVSEIEKGEITVDELSEKVTRAGPAAGIKRAPCPLNQRNPASGFVRVI